MKLELILTALASLAWAKEAPKTLQIGIKKKVAPEDCVAAKSGDKLTMEYTGKLFDGGKQFDSSVGNHKNSLLFTGRGPFEFVLGVGQVIPGWDKGIMGM